MKIKVCKNYEEMSLYAAKIVAEQVKTKPNSVLGLATGSTPIGTYKELIKMYEKGEIDFKNITSVNLDEYYPIKHTDEQSYIYFMNHNLFDHINIDKSKTHVPNGEAIDPVEECKKYDKMIEDLGGIDLQILGIGQNGHIGFNEPDDSLLVQTHLTDLTENTIKANSRFFEKIEDVPTKAITMGVGTIMKSKKIIILANGKGKCDIVNKLVFGNVTTNIPASMLKMHSDVVLICDEEAYSTMNIGIDIGGTDIKYGVIDKNEIVYKGKIPTRKEDGADAIAEDIVNICNELSKKYPIKSVGIGTPGSVDLACKSVIAANLPFENYPLYEKLSERISYPIRIDNDTNCAALGEATVGASFEEPNTIMITIGTGIGGGIIINNKIYCGSKGLAGEIGHMSIEKNGIPCGCGNKGCWEKYASVTALIEQTRKAVSENPNSILAKTVNEKGGNIDGKTVFEAMNSNCEVAKEVFENYISYLACGIKSVINIFNPSSIVLGGGIAQQGDEILIPLTKKVNSAVPIRISKLKNDAGIIGASLLWK